MLKKSDNKSLATRGEEGKSLVEIAVVVMIIAVVIAISLPAIANSIRSYNLRSAAVRIAERLAGARNEGIGAIKQQPHGGRRRHLAVPGRGRGPRSRLLDAIQRAWRNSG